MLLFSFLYIFFKIITPINFFTAKIRFFQFINKKKSNLFFLSEIFTISFHSRFSQRFTREIHCPQKRHRCACSNKNTVDVDKVGKRSEKIIPKGMATLQSIVKTDKTRPK